MAKIKKICTKCQEYKALVEFSKNKNTRDGLQAWCKSCQRAYVASRKPLKAPLSAFEDVVGGLGLSPNQSVLDLVTDDLTTDQEEAELSMLLALAEDRYEDFYQLLALIAVDSREISTVLINLLRMAYIWGELDDDTEYKEILRRGIAKQLTK